MSPEQLPPTKKHFDLEALDLHRDAMPQDIHREQEPPKNRAATTQVSTSGRGLLWFSLVLNLLLAAGSGWMGFTYWKAQKEEQTIVAQTQEAALELNQIKLERDQLSTKLSEAQLQVQTLEKDLKSAKAQGVNQQTSAESEALKASQKEVSRLKDQLAEQGRLFNQKAKDLDFATSKNAQMTENLKDLNQKMVIQEKEWNIALTQAQSQLQESQNRYNQMVADKEALLKKEQLTVSRLNAQLRSDASTIQTMTVQKQELDNRLLQLQNTLDSLQNQKKNLEREIDTLKNVQLGQEVPFSKNLTLPQLRQRANWTSEMKWPRQWDTLVVSLQIDETGQVLRVYIPMGLPLDAGFQRALSDNLLQWKFTPPSLSGVRVKAWIPIAITRP